MAFSLAMGTSAFDHGDDGGGGEGLAAVGATAVAVMAAEDNNWRKKRPVTRALMVT